MAEIDVAPSPLSERPRDEIYGTRPSRKVTAWGRSGSPE
jgi:hypothetical protein